MKSEKLKKIASNLYFSIAVIKECNYKCGYCYPFGQNKSIGINMRNDEFASLVNVAHAAGFVKFKITGGEPTIVNWIFDEIENALNKFSDIDFTIITNGKKLMEHIDAIERHKNRISLQFSLDSVNPSRHDGLQKILDDETHKKLLELSKRKIKTRINMVLTQQNKMEVGAMIKLAAQLGFTIKLFNLFIQYAYIATDGAVGSTAGKYSNLSPLDFWKKNYVPPVETMDYIKRNFKVEEVNASNEEGFGSVQSTLIVDDTRVVLLNSSGGAFFNPDICIKNCPLFGKTCEKGMFNPMVSSNMVLHIDDCNNLSYRWELRNKHHNEMLESILKLLQLFSNVTFVNKPLGLSSYSLT